MQTLTKQQQGVYDAIAKQQEQATPTATGHRRDDGHQPVHRRRTPAATSH